jgi:hypothetical protein
MGASVDGSFDVNSPMIAEWMAEALTRALPQMKIDMADSWDPYGGSFDVGFMNGRAVEREPLNVQTDQQATKLASRFLARRLAYRPAGRADAAPFWVVDRSASPWAWLSCTHRTVGLPAHRFVMLRPGLFGR